MCAAMSRPGDQILVFKYHSPSKEPVLPGEMSDAGMGQGTYEVGLEHCLMLEARTNSENDEYMSQGHKTQLEGDLTGQVRDHFSIKINTGIRRL